MPADKKSLRAEFLAQREGIAPDAAKAAGIEVAKHLVSLIPAAGEVIAGYRAVRGELNIFESLAQLSERGHPLCLPVMKAPRAPLIFRRWRIGQAVEMGPYGIEIPPASEPELIPDIVLVPLVAFDTNGHRLGYGAGFYDATITALRSSGKPIHIIGVAFAMQQAETIPIEPHDAKLDAVVTEKGVMKIA